MSGPICNEIIQKLCKDITSGFPALVAAAAADDYDDDDDDAGVCVYQLRFRC